MENKFKVTEVSAMIGLFAAEDITRTWKEDLTDEETGEVTTFTRKEIVVKKGMYIDNEIASQISFYQQAGELEAVWCSNECREGKVEQHEIMYKYKVVLKDKKRKSALLWAQSVKQAYEVASDWFELNSDKKFIINSISEIKRNVYLKNEDSNTGKLYFIESILTYDNSTEQSKAKYIIEADNTDMAQNTLIEYIRKEYDGVNDIRLEVVRPLKYDTIIPKDFSLPYTDEYIYNDNAR